MRSATAWLPVIFFALCALFSALGAALPAAWLPMGGALTTCSPTFSLSWLTPSASALEISLLEKQNVVIGHSVEVSTFSEYRWETSSPEVTFSISGNSSTSTKLFASSGTLYIPDGDYTKPKIKTTATLQIANDETALAITITATDGTQTRTAKVYPRTFKQTVAAGRSCADAGEDASATGHSLFISATGKLYAAGANDHGQLPLTYDDWEHFEETGKLYTNFTAPYKSSDYASAVLGLATTDVNYNNTQASSYILRGSFADLLWTNIRSSKIYAYGSNSHGQLGCPADSDIHYQQEITFTPHTAGAYPVQIATGNKCALFVTSDGHLYGMGYDGYGYFGVGSKTNKTTPTDITPTGLFVTRVAVSPNHILILTSEGEVYATGRNAKGELGLGDTTERTTFTKIPLTLAAGVSIRDIAVGWEHTLLLTTEGKLIIFGDNSKGQLGIGTADNNAHSTPSTRTITFPDSGKITRVFASYKHSFVLTSTGNLYGAGENLIGQLGIGDATEKWGVEAAIVSWTQVIVPTGTKIVDVSTARAHTLFWTSENELYATGFNQNGQLADHSQTSRQTPVRVVPFTPAFTSEDSEFPTDGVDARDLYSFYYDAEEGERIFGEEYIYADGENISFQWQKSLDNGKTWTDIGDTSENDTSLAVLNLTFADLGARFRVVASNSAGSVASRMTGVYLGPDSEGEFGYLHCVNVDKRFRGSDGETEGQRLRIRKGGSWQLSISDLDSDSAGENENFSVRDESFDGDWEDAPMLGVKDLFSFSLKGAESAETKISDTGKLTVGENETAKSFFIIVRSKLETDEDSEYENRDIYKAIPVSIVTPPAAAATVSHSLFITPDGKLFGTGKNDKGQLGLGNTTDKNIITEIKTLPAGAQPVGVVANNETSYVLTGDGRVFAFGANTNGQLGIGAKDNNAHSTPVDITPTWIDWETVYDENGDWLDEEKVTKKEFIVAVAAGSSHTLLLTATGTLFAIGNAQNGQFGFSSADDAERFSEGFKWPVVITGESEIWYGENDEEDDEEIRAQKEPLTVHFAMRGDIINIAADNAKSLLLLSNGTVLEAGRGFYNGVHKENFYFAVNSPSSGPEEFVTDIFAAGERTYFAGTNANAGTTFYGTQDAMTWRYWQLPEGEKVAGISNAGLIDDYPAPQVLSTSGKIFYYPDEGMVASEIKIGAGSADGVSITGNGSHILFWTKENKLLALGQNTSGQLGDGSTNTALEPIQVYPLAPRFTNNSGTLSAETSSTTGAITLSVSAIGEPAPAFQWQKSTDGGKTWSDIAGKTSATLALNGLSVNDIDSAFRVKLSNAGGTVYSTATTFIGNPTFLVLPAEQNILRGTSKKLTINGAALSDVSWTVQGATSEDTEIADDGTLKIATDEKARSLIITAVDDSTTGGFGRAFVNVIAPSQVAAGASHSLFVNADGILYASGANTVGQLGTGAADFDSHATPQRVNLTLPAGVSVVSIAAGGVRSTTLYSASYVVTSDGKLYTFGSNVYGQLGIGTTDSNAHPTPAAITFPENVKIISVVAGPTYAFALTDDGRVFAIGNNYGNLGKQLDWFALTPEDVTPEGEFIVAIATAGAINYGISEGAPRTIFLTIDGRILYAGYYTGDYSTNEGTPDFPTPVDITPADAVVTSIAAGDYHILFTTEDGKVFSLGDNSAGQCGAGAGETSVNEPRDITPSGKKIVSVAADADSSFFVDSDGILYAFGDNTDGELGVNSSVSKITTPTVVKQNDVPVVVNEVAAGNGHTVIVSNNGTIAAMGSNTNGELGYETTTSGAGGNKTSPATTSVPAAPSFILGEELPATINVGGRTSLVLTVGANGYPAPTFQWQRSDDGGVTWQNLDSTTNSFYISKLTPDENNARIRVRATNVNGTTAWQETVLTGISDPLSPWAFAGLNTKGAKLTAPKVPSGVRLEKKTKARWEWYKDGVLYTTAKSAATFSPKEAGVWSVKLYYTPAGATSETCVETVFGAVKIVPAVKVNKNSFIFTNDGATKKTFADAAIAVEGDTRTLRLTLEQGEGPFVYTFYENNVKKEVRNSYRTTQEWTVTMPVADAKGKVKAPAYKVVVESIAGTNGKPLSKVTTKTLKPKIYVLPRLTGISASPKGATAYEAVAVIGKKVTFSVKVAGTTKFEYRWFKETTGSTAGSTVISTSAKCAIPVSSSEDAGNYYCEVRNPATDDWLRINTENFVLKTN